MHYTFSEIIWLILIYSFLGWFVETIVGTIRKKKFVNRGFSSGPFCFIYGTAAVIMIIALEDLERRPVFLFLGCMAIATMIEWFAGKILERLNQQKWCDYSRKRWNFDGCICLQYSLLWGALGVLAVRYGDSDFTALFHLIPQPFGDLLIGGAVIGIVVDMSVSSAAALHIGKPAKAAVRWNRSVAVVTRRFTHFIVNHVERRMERAYPLIQEARKDIEKEGHFAEGCCFYKIVWLFVIGSFMGDIVETIFCRITAGVWMSRSSLVWGPFSIVWGLAIAAATILLHKDRDKPDRYLFFVGTFWGGAYEYLCSVFSELFFGRVFWDYTGIPFNLGGRINLLYCFFWGIAAVVWIKVLYPCVSGWIEKIPRITGHILTWCLIVFMSVNMLVSAAALVRYNHRTAGERSDHVIDQLLDTYFDDARMERIYPNAKTKEEVGTPKEIPVSR